MTTPKERPILFSGPMVRALLDGTKTQTRRIVKPQPVNPQGPNFDGLWSDTKDPVTRYFACPYGAPGQRLWVKETHQIVDYMQTTRVIYRADGLYQDESWRPSIFMRRMDSRITLEIVSVRVERLQDITEEDAKAEGIEPQVLQNGIIMWRDYSGLDRVFGTSPIRSYESLWDSLNAKAKPRYKPSFRQGPGLPKQARLTPKTATAHPWDSNPWVWVLAFRRLTPSE